MHHISELELILSEFFNWHKSRLNCMSRILQAVLLVRTINLARIATALHSNTKEESAYRRVCRFFTDFSFDLSSIIPFLLKLFHFEDNWILIVDRTNWKWGKTPINILMLSVVYRGISIPLTWSVLDLEGNSCYEDRTSLLRRTIAKIPKERIYALVADREFVGKKWFQFLLKEEIPFVIRVKQSYKVFEEGFFSSISLRQVLKNYGRRKKVLNVPVTLWGFQLYLSFRKGKKGAKEPMIVVSNREYRDALATYKERWKIETLFGCLKTRGFRLEDTHVTDPDKIEKILFVLTIAFCWSLKVGVVRTRRIPIKEKSHKRKSKSEFRIGLDTYQRISYGTEKCIDPFGENCSLSSLLFGVT